MLEAQGHAVKTTIFAEPERRENRNWTEFLLKPNVSFEAVGRYQKAGGIVFRHPSLPYVALFNAEKCMI